MYTVEFDLEKFIKNVFGDSIFNKLDCIKLDQLKVLMEYYFEHDLYDRYNIDEYIKQQLDMLLK